VRLTYSWRELVPDSADFARRRWGAVADLSDTVRSLGGAGRRSLGIDDPSIVTFEGVITGRDDDTGGDEIYLTVTNGDGDSQSFDVEGLTDQYVVGRRMVVRFVEIGRLKNGRRLKDVVQIWLG
jgi:hypothetical protein